MNTKWICRAATAVISAMMLVPAKAQQNNETDPDLQYAAMLLKPGTQAPEFNLPSTDGSNVSLSSFKGRYVVIDFWASWCPDCRKDAPNVVAMYNKYKDKGVAFVGISFDVDAELWKAAIKKYEMNYAHASELKKMRDAEISKAYGVKWIPSLYLIDPQGKVVLATVVSEKIDGKLSEITGVR